MAELAGTRLQKQTPSVPPSEGRAKRKQGQSVAVELTQQQIAGKQSNSDGADEQADHCASWARWGMLARASSKIRATCSGL